MIVWNNYNNVYTSGLLGEYRYAIKLDNNKYDLYRQGEYAGDEWVLMASKDTLAEVQAVASADLNKARKGRPII